MPSTEKTPSGLHLWIEDDCPHLEDLNADNEFLDRLLKACLEHSAEVEQDLASLRNSFAVGGIQNAVHSQTAWKAVNGLENRTFTIDPQEWKMSIEHVTCPYEAFIPVSDCLNNDAAIVMMDAESMEEALASGIANGLANTMEGGIVIYAKAIPETLLSGSYTLVREPARPNK